LPAPLGPSIATISPLLAFIEHEFEILPNVGDYL